MSKSLANNYKKKNTKENSEMAESVSCNEKTVTLCDSLLSNFN